MAKQNTPFTQEPTRIAVRDYTVTLGYQGEGTVKMAVQYAGSETGPLNFTRERGNHSINTELGFMIDGLQHSNFAFANILFPAGLSKTGSQGPLTEKDDILTAVIRVPMGVPINGFMEELKTTISRQGELLIPNDYRVQNQQYHSQSNIK